MKSITNKMIFRSPNYNPAGIRKADTFENLITIMTADFEGAMSTEVLATSYFRNDAELRTNLKLIDDFSETDSERLTELLGSAYVPFTDGEKAELKKVKAVIISREWFMDYVYALDTESDMKETEWYNPTTLENNHFLHAWRVFSTSPFEQAVVFVDDTTPAVTSVSVSPATASVTAGQSLQLSATVATVGFANKAVTWSVSDVEGVEITEEGLLKVASTVASATEITVTATSVYDDTQSATATITVA
jgi:uncharacterized protein YjdB